jgi:ADP-heptose:LPS heptosyltransferase
LIAALLERDRRVLLIGSEGEPLEYDFDPDRCARRIDPPLPELVALIRSCASYIGVDSFPLHIADVYRPDFAGLFAPTAPGSALQRPEMGVRYPYPSLQSVPPAEILAGLERYLLPGEGEQP